MIRSSEDSSALAAFSALSQEHRLAIFRTLVIAGKTGLAAGEIARRLALPASSLSFHLSNLSDGGLIDSRREGRSIIYSASFDQVRWLVGYLLENCCAEESDPNLTSRQITEYQT